MQQKKVHITLQGKGGVGKSLISSMLAQYYQQNGQPITCIDTDPVNATLSGYKALNVTHIKLMDGSRLDERKFDEVMEHVLNNDSHYVVDNGASSFIPLSNYLIENDVINLIKSSGKQIIIHIVITGGQALLDTLNGFAQLVEQLPEDAKVVVWLNEFFGDISSDGKTFEEMKAYTKNKHRVSGIIRIPRQSSDTFGKDISLMLDNKLTFAEIRSNENFGLMAKQRLELVKRAIFEQLSIVV